MGSGNRTARRSGLRAANGADAGADGATPDAGAVSGLSRVDCAPTAAPAADGVILRAETFGPLADREYRY